MKILVVLGGLALVALIVVTQSLYVVDVTEQGDHGQPGS